MLFRRANERRLNRQLNSVGSMFGGGGPGSGGGGLNDVIQEAVRIKNSANAKLRTDFDASPSYMQHTLFVRDDVATA